MDSENPAANLQQIFPAGDVFVVTDDEDLAGYAEERGLRTVRLDRVDDLPDGAAVVLFLCRNLVSREIRRRFRRLRVLLVPVASFDPSPEAAAYTLELTRHTDYRKACDWNRYWVRAISDEPGPLVFEGSGTSLECVLADRLSADAWYGEEIGVGGWISVGSYCEFSLTAPSSSDWHGAFTIDGTAVAAGVLVAKDARVTEAGAARIARAHELRAELAARGPVTLRLDAGVLTTAEAGGEDFTDALREVTNPDYGLHVLELGIGTNMDLLPRVDWTRNSQLNEGAGPVHLGFGEGITGAHVDFIVAESGHRFGESRAVQPQ
ncbi:hypothetical protein [Actinomadura fibrosa]|uniref:Crocagin biosynthetic protein CgnE/B domain-containing protein n=1 Tax=Actinomadura fibrosa TaxID=111802 RepID=A0ABW2XM76_9ACTN|nr:hypothetical protein [Actinomadura fibrosa]